MTTNDGSAVASSGPAAPPVTRRVWTKRRAVSALLFVALIALLCYIGVLGGNVRVVDPGRVYRSSQLTGNGYEAVSARLAGHGLEAVLREDHIATVLNLRGGSDRDLRYHDEVAICRLTGADHLDVPFSARHLPSPQTLEALLYAFDHARYPILIHCQAGSDRTGLASTLYVHLYQHVPLDQAEASQLTWRFGHIRVGPTRVMDVFFDLYRETAHGMPMRQWIHDRYPSLYLNSPLK